VQFFTLFLQVLHFGTVVLRPVERQGVNIIIGNGDAEAAAEMAQFLFIQLFLLVSDVPALAGLAHAIPFDGASQNNRRRAIMLYRSFVCGIYLDRIMATQPHLFQFFIRIILHHFKQTGIRAVKMLADISAAAYRVILVIAVHHLVHAPLQQTLCVFCQQRIPVAAPDHLDRIPAGAAEHLFQFLDDLAVAAHRPVQSLQVAVDNENEIVQLFPHRQGYGAEGFRLVGFAVT